MAGRGLRWLKGRGERDPASWGAQVHMPPRQAGYAGLVARRWRWYRWAPRWVLRRKVMRIARRREQRENDWCETRRD